jgi:hypothetical protein
VVEEGEGEEIEDEEGEGEEEEGKEEVKGDRDRDKDSKGEEEEEEAEGEYWLRDGDENTSKKRKGENYSPTPKIVPSVTSADREKETRKMARSTPTRTNASLRTFRPSREVGIN